MIVFYRINKEPEIVVTVKKIKQEYFSHVMRNTKYVLFQNIMKKQKSEQKIKNLRQTGGILCNFTLFSSSHLSRNSKIRLYKSVVRPVLTYGSEMWTMLQEHEEHYRVFERKVLRWIFGSIYKYRMWRTRTYDELRHYM